MLQDNERKFIINTYNRNPDTNPILVKGRGAQVWDEKGREYLDFVGGLAVNALGHCHPHVIDAAREQMDKIIHTSNLFYTEPQVKLAQFLVENSVADKVFFCNSGGEANEAALKLARKYSKLYVDEGRYEIVTAYNSFHGRTLATLAATGQEKFHKGFEPLIPGFRYASFNDLDSFRSQITAKTCAVMVEPIQGEGGVHVAAKEFLEGLRDLCNENKLLLIFDEVQCGTGRTGKLFAYENYVVEPDIFTLAKALGGGFPIGAMLCKEEVAAGFLPGDHASTFGGNPVACAAALAVLNEIARDDFLYGAAARGQYLVNGLQELKDKFPGLIEEVRGMGLIIGVALEKGGQNVQKGCLRRGLLINCIGDTVLRFLPPLNVAGRELDVALTILEKALEEEAGN